MNIVTKDGLNYFWGKLKDKLNTKVDKYIAYKAYSNDYMYNNTANNNCAGYDREFAQVIANDWNKPWIVKLIIKTDMFYNNTTHYPTFHEVLIGCDSVSGTTWIRNFNVIDNTSYRSAHYITVYRPQSEVKSTDAPFRMCFRAGDASSKTAHPRSYDVFLVEAINCTCTLNNELDNQAFQKWYYDDHTLNAYYWSSKSGGSFYSVIFDICSNGLQETGDSNNYEIVSHYYAYYVAGEKGIQRYTLVMQDKDGKYQSIVNEDNAYTVLTKTANTSQFKLNTPMFYYNSSTKLNSGSRCGTGTLRSVCGPIDLRYSLNVLADATNRLTAYAKLYLVGTVDNDGYFKLNTTKWWTETEPTEEDGKVYIYLGIVYPDTNPYRVSPELEFANNSYWFKNGQFRYYGETGFEKLEIQGTPNKKISAKYDSYGASIDVGYSWDNREGALLALSSVDRTDLQGGFSLVARNETDSATLNGLPNGSLTWCGNNISIDGHKHTTVDITNFPSLSTVATSGNYNDLSNKPTIPTVNNATLTIQKNGTNVATFTANASSNATANITVPTKVSELTNDSGYAIDKNVVHLTGAETVTGNKTFSGNVYLNGNSTTIKDVNKFVMEKSYTSNIIPNYNTATAPPWANNLWHDHLVLLREHEITSKQFTTNGETWEDSSLDITPLFLGKEKNTITLLRATDVAYRFTIKSAQMFHSSSINWYEIAFGWSNPFSAVNVLIEYSLGVDSTGAHTTDESAMTWITLNNSNITASTLSAYFPAQNIYEQDTTKRNYHIRFTFTKLDSTSNGTVPLVYVKGWTYRKGAQGLGVENQYPFDWDFNANMLPIANNTKNIGSSTKKWNVVYANSFEGKATSSAVADKLGTSTIGGTTQALYLNAGVPTAITNNTFANALINSLDTGSSTPVDNDYYVSQYVNGGTTTKTFHRRPMSALYNYVKGKLDSVYQPKGTYLTTLPQASATTLGGVKVGNNLTIDANGVLSAVGGGGGGVSISDVYPVGSVYFSVNNTNPSTLFGGTWVSVGNNLRLSSTDYFWGGITIYAWKRTA